MQICAFDRNFKKSVLDSFNHFNNSNTSSKSSYHNKTEKNDFLFSANNSAPNDTNSFSDAALTSASLANNAQKSESMVSSLKDRSKTKKQCKTKRPKSVSSAKNSSNESSEVNQMIYSHLNSASNIKGKGKANNCLSSEHADQQLKKLSALN